MQHARQQEETQDRWQRRNEGAKAAEEKVRHALVVVDELLEWCLRNTETLLYSSLMAIGPCGSGRDLSDIC